MSHANPILYMDNTFRYGILGVSDIDLSISFIIIVAFIAILYVISVTLLNKGVGLRS